VETGTVAVTGEVQLVELFEVIELLVELVVEEEY